MVEHDIYGGRDPREIPAYGLAEAARYARVPSSTLATWVAGRTYSTAAGPRRAAALIEIPSARPGLLTFSNIVEAFVLASMRRGHGVPLQRVRKAVGYVKRELGVRRPLVSERFRTDGADLFVERFGQLINASREGQLALRDALEARLKRIEWDDLGIAARLYPFPRSRGDDQPKAVVIDPRLAFGRPVLIGTGIPTRMVAERYEAGDSVAALADDYNVTVALIEDALRSELRAAA